VRAVEKVMLKSISIALGVTISVSAIGLNVRAATNNVNSSFVYRSTSIVRGRVIDLEQSGKTTTLGQNPAGGSIRNLDTFNRPGFQPSQPDNYPSWNNNYYTKPNPANIPSSIDRNQNTANTSKPVNRKNNSTFERFPGKASYTPIKRLGGKSCGKNYQFRNGKCESLNN
jgi:hypothetical protein